MNHILCAIDFSESSMHSLMWACKISSLLHSKLEILYTYRLKPGEKELFEYRTQVEVEANRKFDAIKEEIFNRYVIPYVFRIEVGFLHDRVEARIKLRNVSFLVIGNEILNQLSLDGQGANSKSNISSFKLPVVIVP